MNNCTKVGDLVQLDMLDRYGRMQAVDGVVVARFPHGDHGNTKRFRILLGNESTIVVEPERITNTIGR